MIELPLGLRHALESGDCVLFVGAGIGEHLLNQEGKPTPDACLLAKELADEFSIKVDDEYDLAKIAEVVDQNVLVSMHISKSLFVETKQP